MTAEHMTAAVDADPDCGHVCEDAHGVAIVFHDKSRVTEEFVREAWKMKMKANDGFTERSIWSSEEDFRRGCEGSHWINHGADMVVWGGNDELVPLEQGRAYAAGIPGAKLVIVPECGHGPAIEKSKSFWMQ